MRVTQCNTGIWLLFVHCKINWESVMGILHNDEILGCDFQVVGFRRKSRFAIKGDNAKSLLVFEKNALCCEPYCSIAPSGRDPPLGHVRSSSSTVDALRGYQNLYAKEYATRSWYFRKTTDLREPPPGQLVYWRSLLGLLALWKFNVLLLQTHSKKHDFLSSRFCELVFYLSPRRFSRILISKILDG